MHERHLHCWIAVYFLMQITLLWGTSSAIAWAQDVRFGVDIIAPGSLTSFLEKHLPITHAVSESTLSEEAWQGLVRSSPEKIRELLSTEGYFSPTIRSEEQVNDQYHRVSFYIDPGEPVRVTDTHIEFTGQIQLPNEKNFLRMQRLRQQWSLRSSERFTQAAWDAAKNNLLNQLLGEDFPSARITASSALIDPPLHTARLQVNLDSGPAFTLGKLDIHGLSRYPAELIQRVNPLRPGEAFRQERLSELQSRILDTGYFRSAFVTIDSHSQYPQNTPVRVEVTENPAKRLSIGMGISSDVGARLQLKWLNRHFLGEDWRLESVVRADQLSQLAQSEWYFQPVHRDGLGRQVEGWIPSVAIGLERTTLTGTDIDRIRHSVRLATPSRTNERVLSISFLADRRTIPGTETHTRQALVGGYAWTRRHFDQPLSPTRGYSAGIDLSAGFGGAFNVERIARALISGVWLQPLHPRWTAVLRLQAGQIRGAREDSVPEDLLFRTGGDQTVRGYGYGTLGVPRNQVTVGGNVMALISTELIYRINTEWGIALFHDAGDAARSWQDFRWRRGVGMGARWRSPIGALNIDLAHGLDQGETRLHFSVGYGF